MLVRFHIQHRGRRTSVSMPDLFIGYLALHLRTKPGTPEARAAIRAFAEEQLAENTDKHLTQLSAFLLERAIRAIARPSLTAQWLGRRPRKADRKTSTRRR